MDPAPRVLYVSPVVPSRSGSGLAMRAFRMLDLLARRHDVWLLVAPMHGPTDTVPGDDVAARCRGIEVVARGDVPRNPFHAALGIDWSARADGRAGGSFAGVTFDIVHAYRLTALPIALPCVARSGPACVLHVDLDEAESASRRRNARVLRADGNATAARFADLEARRCEALEREIVEHADRVYVSSHVERAALAHAGHQGKLRVVANVVDAPSLEPRPRAASVFRLLFVGTLAYPANEDAVVYFCRDIMPCLRATAPRPFEFVIVGKGATSRLVAQATARDVTLIGPVVDVGPHYDAADAVVVPLRGGGGTRLKVLEAMGRGRPIVSTSTGVDGIDVEPGRHVLIGDTAGEFARQCCRLMADAALGPDLARHAHALVSAAHSADAAAAQFYA